jgi:amino acid transporter
VASITKTAGHRVSRHGNAASPALPNAPLAAYNRRVQHDPPKLNRELGLVQATSLNVANMIGIGPFITIPAFIAAMGGPHALVGWVVAAVLVLCDGLVWSELGAALPGSGGTYHYLREIFGGHGWRRLIPFLFVWQFFFSSALEIASGYLGAVLYVRYMFPDVESWLADWSVPYPMNTLAALCALAVTLTLFRPIRMLGWVGVALCAGSLVTVLTVIVCGFANFDVSLLAIPDGAWDVNQQAAIGLGGAMVIAIYDYLGYYNICHLGDEVRDPGRTIPRAVIGSVLIVALIYLTMNTAILGVVPWQQAIESDEIAALFMETLYGRPVAVVFTGLILWTFFACMFAITLGYSRIPYAAARNGDFFPIFAWLHPSHRYPAVALGLVGMLTAAFCFIELETLIKSAVTVRIAVQFIGQIVALHVLRTRRPDVPLPFRMKLYPIPSLVALVGWIFVLGVADRPVQLVTAAVILCGVIAFLVWQLVVAWRSRP